MHRDRDIREFVIQDARYTIRRARGRASAPMSTVKISTCNFLEFHHAALFDARARRIGRAHISEGVRASGHNPLVVRASSGATDATRARCRGAS